MVLAEPLARMTVAVTLLLAASWICAQPSLGVADNGSSIVMLAEPPPHTASLHVQWIKVAVPNEGTMLAAVAKPAGVGPFPAVLILHGTHGFAREYVEFAEALARDGFLAVAPCWFRGGRGTGGSFITPIECPEAPPLREAASDSTLALVGELVVAVRGLPDVRRDRIGLFGHSRGGGAALNYVLSVPDVQAAALNSAGYPALLADRVSELRVPLLILHGTADTPADGGSSFTNIEMARNFAAAVRGASKVVETQYYEGGRHNGLFADSDQFEDELKRVADFFSRNLRR
jgi:dienelactone hydrolase